MVKAADLPPPDFDALISVDQAGLFLGISGERVRQLIKGGYISRPKPGRVILKEVARGYAKFHQDIASKGTKNAADSRLRDARAIEVERRIAIQDRELVPAEEATAAIDHILAACAEAFAALPAMVTRDIEERTRIEKIIKRAQGEVAKKLGEAGKLLEEGGELPDAR